MLQFERVEIDPMRYAVMQADDAWRIVGQDRRIGQFQSRERAVALGSRLAREAYVSGHEVELLVQEDCGEMRRQDFLYLAAAA